jgi:NADH-quinone oxidoreductase subunit N
VSAYYYLRVVMVMYMRESEAAPSLQPRLATSPALTMVLASAVAGVVLLGVYPDPLVSIASLAVLPFK